MSENNHINEVKAAHSLVDYIIRLGKYAGHGLAQLPRSILGGLAEGWDDVSLFIIELYKFHQDREKNLKKFDDQLAKPFVYYLLSHLLTFGVLTIHSLIGIFAAVARTAIQTISRLTSLVRLLTAKTDEDDPSEIQEQIYAEMDSFTLVLRSALLVLGSVGLSLLGIPALAVAGVVIGGLLVYGIVSIVFPNAIPAAQKWFRRHEPLILKKAVAELKSAYHWVKHRLLGVKELDKDGEKKLFQIADYTKPIDADYYKNKKDNYNKYTKENAADWGLTESAQANARIKNPRPFEYINRDVGIHLDYLQEELKLMSKSKLKQFFYKERYEQRINVLTTLKDISAYILENKNIKCNLNSLNQCYDEYPKAFDFLGYGISPVAGLFHELKARLEENIQDDIKKYKEKYISKDTAYYKKLTEASNSIAQQRNGYKRLDHFNTTKAALEKSVNFLETISSRVTDLVNNPEAKEKESGGILLTHEHLKNPSVLQNQLIDKLRYIDPDFTNSISHSRKDGRYAFFKSAVMKQVHEYNIRQLSIPKNK